MPPLEPPSEASRAETLVRLLAWRYLLVLSLIAALMLVDQAIIQPLLVRMDSYAPVINLAGRQRMLSQKLAKASLAVDAATDAARQEQRRRELEKALAELIEAHDALRYGSEKLATPRIDSTELVREWLALERDFTAIVAAARQIIDGTGGDSSAAAILNHEAPFLERMERIVGLFELAAAQELTRLRVCSLAIAAAVVSLLVVLGWLVIRPATQAIRQQVDELELQVAQRTADLAGMVASLQREVAERKLAETRGQRLAAQLAHADRVASMGHLAIGLAHELNQPLAAIANYAGASEVVVAKRSPDDDHHRLNEYLQHIGAAALRAGQIVHRIRKFVARSSADSSIAAEVDLATLVQEVLDLCQFEIRRADVTTTIELGARPATVRVDAIQIQQVLVNLVQNALQSMQAFRAHTRLLEIRLEADDDWAEVSVLDNGAGFNADDLEAPFAAFHTTKPDGLGVGLSICRTIIDAHEGAIVIKPTAVGAHVAFRLPIAKSLPTIELDGSCPTAKSDLVCR